MKMAKTRSRRAFPVNPEKKKREKSKQVRAGGNTTVDINKRETHSKDPGVDDPETKRKWRLTCALRGRLAAAGAGVDGRGRRDLKEPAL